jgi:hypothetical protein
MDEITGSFAWLSERTSDQECRVSVRVKNKMRTVHIDAYKSGRFYKNHAIFLPEQLPLLIQALQKAQAVLHKEEDEHG